jgi:hypothetical protein
MLTPGQRLQRLAAPRAGVVGKSGFAFRRRRRYDSRTETAMRSALLAILVSLAAAGEAPIASPAPLPAGVTAEAANLGPVDGAFRLDFAFPTVRGCDPSLMDLQVIHAGMVIIGNDYTRETMAAVGAAHHERLEALSAQTGNVWTRFKEQAAIASDAFVGAYTAYAALDDAANFTIACDGDPAYGAQGKPPLKVTRYAMPRGDYRDFHLAKGRECSFGTLLAN